MPANVPTGPNRFSKDSGSERYGQLKPPEIEWQKNDPKTTKHMATPDSSWIQSISYDSTSQRMTITTKEGTSWQHAQVSPGQFEEMQTKPSKGSYYTRTIKGQHPATSIKKNPKPSDYPGRKQHEPKDNFKNPLYDHLTRYKKGRYS